MSESDPPSFPIPGPAQGPVTCEVLYMFQPGFVSTQSALDSKFREMMRKEFGFTTPPKPEYSEDDLKAAMGTDNPREYLSQVPPAQVDFTRGRYDRIGKPSASIITVRIHDDVVFVKVLAETSVAESILHRVAELMTETMGASSSWEELERVWIRREYATQTTGPSGYNLLDALDPGLRSFIREQMNSYAPLMLPEEQGHPRGRTITVVHPYEFRFRIRIFDELAGMERLFNFRLMHPEVTDFSKQQVTVTSELKYTDHLRLVEELKRILAKLKK